ncbi:unnamed protein product [Cylicocyclus nassatus]|uniref:Uncharacterized protein n=1 Tax=Cylicocyclus nassatus TaxID=53992 RepID=A0AA36DS58_CYLNA|nr:unnamed protein product [Cylicocyclus nassatus]
MAGSYNYVTHQASNGNTANSNINKWIADGLNSALVNIKNNDREEITYDNHEDNWKTASSALGKHQYVDYNEEKDEFVSKQGFGLTAKDESKAWAVGDGSEVESEPSNENNSYYYSERSRIYRDFEVQLQWLDPTNVAHVDILEKEDDVYKEDYQRYSLPVTSPLNRYAGEIEMKLVFTMVDYENQKKYKLESDTICVEIATIKDYYAVMPDESFSYIDDKVSELKAIADQMNADAQVFMETKADNITLNQTTNELQLTALDKKIGDPVVIDLIDEADKELDELDGKVDGVIDLDDIDWENVNL